MIMVIGKILCVIRSSIFLLPHDVCHKVFLSKHVVSNLTEIVHLGIINGYEKKSVVPQQNSRQY